MKKIFCLVFACLLFVGCMVNGSECGCKCDDNGVCVCECGDNCKCDDCKCEKCCKDHDHEGHVH